MPRIIEYTPGSYKVDSHVINKYTDDLNVDDNERVGIYRNHKVIVPDALFSDWLDPTSTPYASLDALIQDINTFFFSVDPFGYPQVTNRNALPVSLGTPGIGEIYIAEQPITETFLGLPYKTWQAGPYIRDFNNGNLNDWRPLPFKVSFTDAEFKLVNASSPGKQGKFSLASITDGIKRTFTFQDKDYTIAGLDDTGVILQEINADFQLNDATTYNANQVIRLQNRSGNDWVISTTGADTVEGESSVIIFDGETFDLTITGTDFRL